MHQARSIMTPAFPQHNIKTSQLPEVIKGSADWREFRPLQLPNGITCLLVNDKESKTTACSVSVGVGASADPRGLSGLAHFTEHMCFLGSEAYPEENEFKSYLSAHGGRSNASTSMSQTCYKFDVLAEHAEKVIDIFGNFFVSPLFTQSGTSREVNAVDSENSKNESNDGRRRLQILKALADPSHHYSKFSTGNAITLPAVDGEQAGFVREALLAFHKRHYRPDNMTVVVVGPQSLDVLEEWIVPRFAKIQTRYVDKGQEEMTQEEKLVNDSAEDQPNDSFGSPPVPYNPAFKPEIQGQWPVLLTTKPLQSLRKIFLYFPLPSTREMGDQSPYSLLSHLLGHEGKGSCFAVLQDAELVDTLSVGPRLADSDQSLLQINISLTEKGEEQWREVVATIFEYCRMLEAIVKNAKEGSESDQAVLERTWDEICTIRQLSFHQNSPSDAFSFVPSVANSVRTNGTERCLSLGSLLNETKESIPLDHFSQFLQSIHPENCIIERCSRSAWEEAQQNGEEETADGNIFGFQNEQWYGVQYHLCRIPPSDVLDWKKGGDVTSTKNLHLPTENVFIPRDLSLCADLPEDAMNGPRISKEMDPPLLIVTNEFGMSCMFTHICYTFTTRLVIQTCS
jgi:insulysin